ncbi:MULTISPECIES: glycoside hydrolase family 2 protein [Flavobacterium]|uniref:glycoside hydrolase family 2 protein n=1 Tax=Flavobacterium TaxID=237 RepID=UPI0021156FD5|nr:MULTISPECIES: glycoside hydrolase family 2 TIM barrel-domain containing protein [Flavobacterium]UUF12479.1 glycoside hydrolase family 2 [Flavobacterium panici]
MNKKREKIVFKKEILVTLIILFCNCLQAQTAMVNVQSRHLTSLNGKWNVLLDPGNIGGWKKFWIEPKPQKKTDFFEYSFNGAPELNVPGDFNSQLCELAFYEGSVWYKKTFHVSKKKESRQFLHFGAVNYIADVYLNEEKVGSHEGGFTPFQFEITDKIKEGNNILIVQVDNRRVGNGIPGYGYDWLNYGGITRDVNIIETQNTYIDDYSIQLKKGSLNNVLGWIQLNGEKTNQKIKVKIPELNIVYKTTTDDSGYAKIDFSSRFKLWSPENPKLYKVILESETDSIIDEIGFRSIEVEGSKILLNKKTIFIKAVNIHEENPLKKSRAYSLDDAKLLLNSAKELGCNLVRLAHYPHNENMIKEAEKMGLMIWNELPVYQNIQFSDSLVPKKMETMLKEMISRDKNRCGVVVWSLSNETYSSTPNRDKALLDLTEKCKAIDSTRLVTHVINTQGYTNNSFNVWDTLYNYSDLIAINEYVGWYVPWQGKPLEATWKVAFPNKPVFISEFGGEALFANKNVPTDQASSWSEEYQQQIYKDQIEMFNTIPNLSGVCPWILYDYRSLGRMHPVYQKGYNRKGLISENGDKKKAWYIMSEYYKRK